MKTFLKTTCNPLVLTLVMIVVSLATLPALAQKMLTTGPSAPSIGGQIFEASLPGIVTIIVGLVGILGIVINVGGKAWVTAHVQNTLLKSALLYLNDIAGAVVTKLEQTAAADLRERAAKGQITSEDLTAELAKLKSIAYEEVLALTVGRLLGAGISKADAETIINATIETAVPAAKTAVSASRSPSALAGGVDPLPSSAAG